MSLIYENGVLAAVPVLCGAAQLLRPGRRSGLSVRKGIGETVK